MGVAAMSEAAALESLTGQWDRNGGSLAIDDSPVLQRSPKWAGNTGAVSFLQHSVQLEMSTSGPDAATLSVVIRICTTDAFCASESPSKAGGVPGAGGRV